MDPTSFIFDIRKDDMPEEMRILLSEYPRETWETHPCFKEMTRDWLGAHQMFRRLADLLRQDAEAVLDRLIEPVEYAPRLYRFGNALVGSLRGHHAWEDHEYFPELSAADPRFVPAIDVLEKDHEALDQVLSAFIEVGENAVEIAGKDDKKMRDRVGILHGITEAIEALLDRHLGDEEEIAVPIILHYRLRG
ncbi:MAG: hemerythrin domain-containing protein [Pseudomonadota bacterium]